MPCMEIEYGSEGFYEIYQGEAKRRIYIDELLQLLCPELKCGQVNIGIVSKNIHKTVIDFASFLERVKKGNTSVRKHIKKYKVFAFIEIEELQNCKTEREMHLIFHCTN